MYEMLCFLHQSSFDREIITAICCYEDFKSHHKFPNAGHLYHQISRTEIDPWEMMENQVGVTPLALRFR